MQINNLFKKLFILGSVTSMFFGTTTYAANIANANNVDLYNYNSLTNPNAVGTVGQITVTVPKQTLDPKSNSKYYNVTPPEAVDVPKFDESLIKTPTKSPVGTTPYYRLLKTDASGNNIVVVQWTTNPNDIKTVEAGEFIIQWYVDGGKNYYNYPTFSALVV